LQKRNGAERTKRFYPKEGLFLEASVCRLGRAVLLLVAFLVGCSQGTGNRPSSPGETPAEAEKALRARFAEVRAAVKARDVDKLWGLLSSKSQAEAAKEAKAIRTAYERASPKERAQQEKDEGLRGKELAKLTGQGSSRAGAFTTSSRKWSRARSRR
jgi:hypothetical protein